MVTYDEHGKYVDADGNTFIDPLHPENIEDPRWNLVRQKFARAQGAGKADEASAGAER